MEWTRVIWIIIEVLVAYNLILPFILFLIWRLKPNKMHTVGLNTPGFHAEADYAVIVTAYEQTDNLKSVVASIQNTGYQNYTVYIVADKCDVYDLNFEDENVVLLRPEATIGSNTGSHRYAIDHFLRPHQLITIIDSDNLLAPGYFKVLNEYFQKGYRAVQGLRAAKNLDTDVSRLDAARDIYYHFYDGKILHQLGSSATLAGSGMAFDADVYRHFLDTHQVSGAGFDKVLQHYLVKQGLQIAFAENAVVFDEKTSKNEQLVKQRARWINTWFKYFKLGFSLLFKGLVKFNLNQFLFGLILLRPPLFLFILASLFCLLTDAVFGHWEAVFLWILAMLTFVTSFFLSLSFSNTDRRIYKSLKNIPKFISLQLISLIKSRHANRHSVSTRHYHSDNSEPSKETSA